MTSKSPVFPIMPEPQHFSDYGFDPQLHYFQVLAAARKHKKDACSRSSIDSLHFKLQKPIIISKDIIPRHHHHHSSSSCDKSNKKKMKKKKWWHWTNALLLFKWKGGGAGTQDHNHGNDDDIDFARAQAFRASISGPVYITESASYHTCSGPTISVGGFTPTRKGEAPYLSLRELNLEQEQRATPPSSRPIYLVT